MSGVIPLLPQYVFVAWTGINLPSLLHISLHTNSFHVNTVNTFTAECNFRRLLQRNFIYSTGSLSPSRVRILSAAACFKA
jgi:hypothetical protein